MSVRIPLREMQRELDEIVHIKGAFQKIEVVARKARTLMSLEVVRASVGGSDSAAIGSALVLRSVCVAARQDLDDATDRKAIGVLFGILDEKEMREMGLEEHHLEDLGDRRDAIKEFWGGEREFRRGDEPELVALFAGALATREARFLAQNPGTESAGVIDPVEGNARLDIHDALGRVFPTDVGLRSLSEMMIPDRPSYYETLIELTVSDDPADDDLYSYGCAMTFKTVMDEFVLALVDKASMVDQIMSETGELADVWVCPSRSRAAEIADDLVKSETAFRAYRATGGRSLSRIAHFERVPEGEYANYQGETCLDPERVLLLRVPLSPFKRPGDLVKVKFSNTHTLRKSEHFCFWKTDRMTQVQRIEIDASEFTVPDSSAVGFRVHPFMMSTNEPFDLGDSAALSVDLDTWLLRGQGFACSW